MREIGKSCCGQRQTKTSHFWQQRFRRSCEDACFASDWDWQDQEFCVARISRMKKTWKPVSLHLDSIRCPISHSKKQAKSGGLSLGHCGDGAVGAQIRRIPTRRFRSQRIPVSDSAQSGPTIESMTLKTLAKKQPRLPTAFGIVSTSSVNLRVTTGLVRFLRICFLTLTGLVG